jgi:hypothetical protein
VKPGSIGPRLAVVAGLLGLAGCQGHGDPYCRMHNAADLAPGRAAYAAMSQAERRASEDRLNAYAQRCGWEP